MKYHFVLPLSALLALVLIAALVKFEIIPLGLALLQHWQSQYPEGFTILLFTIILLESIVYLGFYLPGQFFAVVMVILAKPDSSDMFNLTLLMVAGATLGSLCNYVLGYVSRGRTKVRHRQAFSFKALLLAMIHINALAFYMFNRGAQGASIKLVWLAGLLNLPYYLLLVVVTTSLSEKIMQLAENNLILIGALSIWLVVAVTMDFRVKSLGE